MAKALKSLTADEILKAEDRVVEPVDVPEWGGRVFVRTMDGHERDEFDTAGISEDGEQSEHYLKNYRARVVAATCCDESGQLLFTQSQAEALGRKNSAVLSRIARVAQRLNGMSKDAIATEKKDSSEVPSDASPTVSA